MPRDYRDKTNAMRRTYILSVLILICVAYILNRRFVRTRGDLASAKDKIAHIAQQPSSHASIARTPAAVWVSNRTSEAPGPQAEAGADASWRVAPPIAGDERVVHLTKGTFTVVDGAIVYGPDALLDIGNGVTVSSPTGVMVSDVEQRHIAGDLVIESQDSTTTAVNAFLSIDRSHVEIASDNSTTVSREAPK
jgi:hypothetical protein